MDRDWSINFTIHPRCDWCQCPPWWQDFQEVYRAGACLEQNLKSWQTGEQTQSTAEIHRRRGKDFLFIFELYSSSVTHKDLLSTSVNNRRQDHQRVSSAMKRWSTIIHHLKTIPWFSSSVNKSFSCNFRY